MEEASKGGCGDLNDLTAQAFASMTVGEYDDPKVEKWVRCLSRYFGGIAKRRGLHPDDIPDQIEAFWEEFFEKKLLIRLDPQNNPVSYLAKRLNWLISEDRRRKRLQTVPLAAVNRPIPDKTADPTRSLELDEALQCLDEEDLLVIRMRLEGWSFAEIAKKCGKTEAAVRRQYYRALEKLRRRRRGL